MASSLQKRRRALHRLRQLQSGPRAEKAAAARLVSMQLWSWTLIKMRHASLQRSAP